jgi:hypothetical protein
LHPEFGWNSPTARAKTAALASTFAAKPDPKSINGGKPGIDTSSSVEEVKVKPHGIESPVLRTRDPFFCAVRKRPARGAENSVCDPPFHLYLPFRAAQGVQPARRVKSASHRASRE